MLLAVYTQNRWTYYFAVNFAIICGYMGSLIIGIWTNKHKSDMFNLNTKNIPITLVIVIVVLFILVYPSFNYSINNSKYANNGDPSGGGFEEWYETLTWIKNNTPDTGVDYYGTYNKPYIYPDTAYGILSWWDYGHIITYYAHRIPTANPFQSGIGGSSGGDKNSPGASTFLISKSEDEATKILNEIGNVKYVISNSYMAYQIMNVFGVWAEDGGYITGVKMNANTDACLYYNGNICAVPTNIYFQNMESKLHIFDGRELSNYRLIHESGINPNTLGGYQELKYKYWCNVLYNCNIPMENSGLVKVFEVVKGAKITGVTTPNTEVVIYNKIKTNIGREFDYTQKVMSDDIGTYTFTVPYSTNNFAKEYSLLGKSILVSESDVINGGIIYV